MHPKEKPLAGAAKAFLALGAAGIILLFYLFVLLCVVALSFLLTMARLGAAGIMAMVMNEHLASLLVFLWLRKGREYLITLKPDASVSDPAQTVPARPRTCGFGRMTPKVYRLSTYFNVIGNPH